MLLDLPALASRPKTIDFGPVTGMIFRLNEVCCVGKLLKSWATALISVQVNGTIQGAHYIN